MANDCGDCGEVLESVGDGLKCKGCRNYLHYECAGVAESTYKKMAAAKKEAWRCGTCQRRHKSKPIDESEESGEEVTPGNEDIKKWLIKLDGKMNVQIENGEKLANAFQTSQEDVKKLFDFYDDLRKEVKESKDEIKSLKKEVNVLTQRCREKDVKFEELEKNMNSMEQYGRRKTLEIHGLQKSAREESKEDLLKSMKKIALKLNIQFENGNIEEIYRLPAKTPDSVPIIIVKFATKDLRDCWLNLKKSKLVNGDIFGQGNSEKIYFNESLTLCYKKLFWLAKQKARAANYKYVWTRNGKLFARRNDGGVILKIESVYDIEKIK